MDRGASGLQSMGSQRVGHNGARMKYITQGTVLRALW